VSEFRVESALNIFRCKHYSVSYFMKEWSRDGTSSFDFNHFFLRIEVGICLCFDGMVVADGCAF
jgi:hypothetical protein